MNLEYKLNQSINQKNSTKHAQYARRSLPDTTPDSMPALRKQYQIVQPQLRTNQDSKNQIRYTWAR